MANNPYVNKVVYGSSTLIDISDTTATASDVASGKYFYTAAGQKVQGTASSGSIVISDTTDSHGGTIKTITTGQTLNLQSKTVTPTSSQQTITPDTGYNGLSEVIVGAVSGGYIAQDANGHIVLPPTGDIPTLISKTVTQNGTYSASSDNVSGYSSVTVNVQASGGTMNMSVPTVRYSASIVFGNIQSSPSAFVMVWDRGSSGYDQIPIKNNAIASVSYDGTNTEGWYYGSLSGGSGYLYRLTSGYVSWSYNGSQHELTFSVSVNGTYQFNNNDDSYRGYRLYYV